MTPFEVVAVQSDVPLERRIKKAGQRTQRRRLEMHLRLGLATQSILYDVLLREKTMQVALSFFVAAFIATLLSYSSVSAETVRAATSNKAQLGVARSRPQVVENGSDLALFNFTGNISRAVAFAPDGSSYSVVRDGVLKIEPNGAQSFLTLFDRTRTSVYQNIAYANGFLWFSVYHGIVRIRPDGTGHRFYQFGVSTTGFEDANDMVAGADGLYFTALAISFSGPRTEVIGRIGYADFKLTLFKVPVGYREVTLVSTPDGHFDYLASYAVYEAQPVPHSNIFTSLLQIQSDATSEVLGSAPGCGNNRNAVVALGAIYYVGTQFDTSGNQTGYALCRATLSGKIGPIAPTVTSPGVKRLPIAADNSGNLWTVDLFGNGLYSYNVVSKQLAGAYEPSVLSTLDSNWLYVGPDQNVWLFGYYATNQLFYGAYVRHKQVFTPTSVSLNSVTPSVEFFVSELLKSAPWTAVSLNPAVATVSPASSLVGRFHVSRVGIGTTAIAVTDAYGNVSYETVTSN